MKQGPVGLLPESADDLAKLAKPKLHCWLCQKRFEPANVLTQAGWRETQISGLCELCFDDQFKEDEPATPQGEQPEYVATPQPAQVAEPVRQAGEGHDHEKFDAIAAERYRVVPNTSGYWGFAVVAGDGAAQLYKGHKRDCELVARRMAGAFLDGAFLASQDAAPQQAQGSESGSADGIGKGDTRVVSLDLLGAVAGALKRWGHAPNTLTAVRNVIAQDGPAANAQRDAALREALSGLVAALDALAITGIEERPHIYKGEMAQAYETLVTAGKIAKALL